MSAGLVDNYQPAATFQQLPHRKPLPPGASSRPLSMARFPADQQQQHQYTVDSQVPPQLQPGSRTSYAASNSSTRPSSSSTLPGAAPAPSYSQVPQNTNPVSYQAHMNQYMPTTKRTLSNATASTSSTGGTTKVNSSASSTLQRTTSARSNQPTSYVALMRKQKATVWCDRAQQEDPRLLAQQRAAKMRAAMDISNASTAGRTSTSGSSSMIRSKIRHHGAPKAQQYTPDSHPHSGVPMRLSAREVDEDDSDDDSGHNTRAPYHQRSGSGRSSVGSGRFGSMHTSQHGSLHLPSTGSTPSSAQGTSPVAPRSPKEGSTSSPQRQTHEYFGKVPSGGSEEDEELNFGGVGGLPQRMRVEDEEARKQDLAELRRRGSVDERTMTMSGYGRLYVANPDID